MTDIAGLGIAIDASQIGPAVVSLDQLAQAGARTDAAVGKLSDTTVQWQNKQMQVNDMQKQAAAAADLSAAAIKRQDDQLQALLNRFDPLGAKLRSVQKDFETLNEAIAGGQIGSGNDAAQKAMAGLNAELAAIQTATAQVGAAGAAGFGQMAEGAHGAGLATAGVTREFIVLGHEAMSGNFSRIPGSMLVLGERMGGLAALITPLTLGLAALGVAGVAFIATMMAGAAEQRAMNDALILTGNYAGLTSAGLHGIALAATAAGGSLSEAKKVVTELAATGKYTGDQIATITTALIEVEHATGGNDKAVQGLVKSFESLEVQAGSHARYTDSISKATLKLDDEYHFLTASVFEHIHSLEADGHAKEASAIATDAFAQALHDRSVEMVSNLGTVERAWDAIKEAVGRAKDAIMDMGKPQTAQSNLVAAQNQVSAVVNMYGGGLGQGDLFETFKAGTAAGDAYAKAIEGVRVAQAAVNAANGVAAAQGANAQKQSETNHVLARIEAEDNQLKLDKMSQLDRKLQEYNAQLQTLRDNGAVTKELDPDVIAAHEAALRAQFAVKTPKGHQGNEFQDQQTAMLAWAAAMKEGDAAAEKASGHLDGLTANEIKLREIMDSSAATLWDKLNPALRAMVQAKYDAAIADDKAAASNAAYDTMLKDIDTDGKKQVDTLTAQIAKQVEHNAEIGKTKSQIDDMRAAREEASTTAMQNSVDDLKADQDALDMSDAQYQKDHDLYQAKIDWLTKIIQLRKDDADALRSGAAAEASAAAAKQQAAEYQAEWHATDTFVKGVFETWGQGGANMATKLGNDLKKALSDAFYQYVIRPIELKIFANIMGSDPSADGSAPGTMSSSGIVSLINGGNNVNSVYNYGNKAYDWLFGNSSGISSSAPSSAGSISSMNSTDIAATHSDLGYTGNSFSGASSDASFSTAASNSTADGAVAAEGAASTAGPYGLIAAAIIMILAGRDATRVQSTGDSRTQFNPDGTVNNKANALYGGDQPVVIPSIVNGQAVNATPYSTYAPYGAMNVINDNKTQADLDKENAVNNAAFDSHVGGINDKADAYLKTVNDAYLAAAKNLGVGTVSTQLNYGSNDSDGGKFRLSASTAGGPSFDSGEIASSNDAMSLAANRAILTALEGSDLPKWMKGVFDNVDASKLDQAGIDGAIKKVTDLKTTYDILGSIKGVDITTLTYDVVSAMNSTAPALQLVNAAFDKLGFTLLNVSVQGGQAAANLVAAFGGLQQASTAMGSYFQNFYSKGDQANATYSAVQSSLHAVGIDYTIDQIQNANRTDIRAVIDSYQSTAGTTDGATKIAALVNAANLLTPLTAALGTVTAAAPPAAAALGGGGGGGVSGALTALQQAAQSATDSIFADVTRIRGLVTASNGTAGYADSQAQFAIATAQANSGDAKALASLPRLADAMLALAQTNETSLYALQLVQARTANSLEATGLATAGKMGLTVPSYDSGTAFVPFDQLAMVHKGERVVTASQNAAGDDESEVAQLLAIIITLLQPMRQDAKRTADVTEKWDAVGPLAPRTTTTTHAV